MKSTFYITTTLPYVNASPHIGFAMEITAADAIARYQRLLGKQVIFNTGTDEHGQKIYQEAQAASLSPQQYVDEYAAKFDQLKKLLNLSYDRFIRTTDSGHVAAAQEFWRRCQANGDIYKKLYKIKYCIGCELEKTESELVDNRCPLHPNKDLEIREEENYFFAFSKYEAALLELYSQADSFVQPAGKLKEITSFVQNGLQDFSISRIKSKMPWGVPVPDDTQHVMYVWFDALVNYISTLGWPQKHTEFEQFWPGVQIAGKDNLRQQAAMWQAMLLSAQLPPSKKILINGFISVAGQKMSKSLGNVIAPDQLVDRYGVEGARYLLLHLGPVGEDIDVTWQRFDEIYTADLANGLGNLISRVAKLCQRSQLTFETTPASLPEAYTQAFDNYDFGQIIQLIKAQISALDLRIDQTQPWKLEGAELKTILIQLHRQLQLLAHQLQPLLPQTADQMFQIFGSGQVVAPQPIFPRLAASE